MNPLLLEQLRRNWQPLVALAAFLVLWVAHLAWFQPAHVRLEKATHRAQALGGAYDPDHPIPIMPPRVMALLADNALSADAAVAQGNSGALAAELLEYLTEAANRHGIEVVATQPGSVAQEERAVQVRAHIRARCSYAQFVAFLDDLARGDALIAVDRFSLQSQGPGRNDLELDVTRYVLKRPEKRS